MGTSASYRGPGSGTPLVPTWLDPDPYGAGMPDTTGSTPEDGQPEGRPPEPALSALRPIQPPPTAARFRAARNSFSRFARSGGTDRASLGRALFRYVVIASGGPRQAARRMGASRDTGRQLLSFLSDAATRGARQALRTVNLESLAGQPIEEIFVGLTKTICPDGGTVDEGIAREAFVETIAELAANGISDLDALTANQVLTIFELFVSHAIEARLYNDIGAKAIMLPTDARDAERVQTQLRDFIRRSVADAVNKATNSLNAITQDQVAVVIDNVYEETFAILQALGESEAQAS